MKINQIYFGEALEENNLRSYVKYNKFHWEKEVEKQAESLSSETSAL